MSNKITARIEGSASYSDESEASFGATIDDDGIIVMAGDATVFGDIILTVKALFTALGGTLTASPTTSGKTVTDKTAKIEMHGIYGLTQDVEAPFSAAAEYTAKMGTITTGSVGGYAVAKNNFNSSLKALVVAASDVANPTIA